jgi:hypothetical protein
VPGLLAGPPTAGPTVEVAGVEPAVTLQDR